MAEDQVHFRVIPAKAHSRVIPAKARLRVIPAKAGIQPLVCTESVKSRHWIPAFAGMTGRPE